MADPSQVVGEGFVKIRPFLGSFLGELNSGLGSIFRGATAAATNAGLAIAAGLTIGGAVVAVSSAKMASDFESAMERIHSQANVSQLAVNGLSQSVLGLAGKVGEAPNQLADALYHVESAFESTGITGQKAMQILQIAAQGARVGNANLIDVTNALDAAIVAGIPGVENFQQAMGALNATVGAGDMTMQNLADALGTGVLAVIKGYGVTLRDASAALATFGDNNIRGAQAGTSLRMAIQALAVPVAAGKKTLAELGLTTQSLAVDMQQGGLNQALTDLVERMTKAGITGAKVGDFLTQTFGKRAGTGVAILVEQFDRFQSKLTAVDQGANRFGDSWAATQQTTSQKLAELRASFDSVMIQIGTRLLPVVGSVAEWFAQELPIAYSKTVDAINHVHDAISSFVSFIVNNQGKLEILGSVITAVLLPATIRLGIATAASLGESAILWTLYAADAAVAAASAVASFVFMAGQSYVNAVATAASWTLTAGSAAASAVASTASYAGSVIGSFVTMATQSAINAAKTAASWTLTTGQAAISAVSAVASATGSIIASWAAMSYQVGLNAAANAASWVATAGTNAATAALQTVLAAGKIAISWTVIGTKAFANGVVVANAWAQDASAAIVWSVQHPIAAAKVIGSWIAMGVTATVNAVKVAAAWAASVATTAAIAVATTVSNAATIIASWTVMGIQSTIQAGKTAAAWTLTAGKEGSAAVASTASLVTKMVAQWTLLAVQATAGAVRSAGAWTLTTGIQAGKAIATTTASVATMIAQWALLAARSTISAAKAAVAWLISTGPEMIAAVAGTVASSVAIVASWVAMAAAAGTEAIVVATAWLISIAPLAIVVAAIAGAVYLIIKYWHDIRQWAEDAWNGVVAAIKAAWDWITQSLPAYIGSFIDELGKLPKQITDIFGDAVHWLEDSGSKIIQGLVNGIKHAANTILTQPLTDVVNKIKGFFPFSPAKEGPFTGSGDPFNSGVSIGNSIGRGLRSRSTALGQSAAQIASAIQGGLAVGAALGSSSGISFAGSTASSSNVANNYNLTLQGNYRTQADPAQLFARMQRLNPLRAA